MCMFFSVLISLIKNDHNSLNIFLSVDLVLLLSFSSSFFVSFLSDFFLHAVTDGFRVR